MDTKGKDNPPNPALPTRIPTLKEIKQNNAQKTAMTINFRDPYILYNDYTNINKKTRNENLTYCFISVIISFIFGLAIGIVIMSGQYTETIAKHAKTKPVHIAVVKTVAKVEPSNEFKAVSFTGQENKYNKDIYPKGLTEDMKDILKDTKSDNRHAIILNKTFTPDSTTVLYDNIYWGPQIEDAMPQGYGEGSAKIWEQYINDAEVVKMEAGCGRMQNRLVTFKDGLQACVRYRQNTDQIQGEIFSFYVGRLLNLTNLAPSVVRIVDLKDKLWKNVANDIGAAQWGSNRAVVLTQYIPSLESASIPDIFRPTTRHLNKYDILKMSLKENDTESKHILIDKLRIKDIKSKSEMKNFTYINAKLNKKTIDKFLELAQWSDLIIFDYLTANLDRIVNNLFNYQWNVNIMDGPAHNLAKKMDSGLLIFLDNESGLLHGYRLLKKYNVYHSLMLDNLCVFRRRTIDALQKLFKSKSVGSLLSDMFHKKNSIVIRDILPSLPEKNAKILIERIGKVLSQVEKCEVNSR
ncbi:extracellular serine/threonine protein kinase four-jointed [Spodoptera frugiperda]|uniref:Extracellular serine/threonine protein kinase four-jointed n=1 Tax=Spodoptera frugiperda TaxID=7108 RepID=A0A9R0DJ26_SPOFR|nr:extracellular serine/threonine protein kinase four-jointed [Spodoptera frugiperda]